MRTDSNYWLRPDEVHPRQEIKGFQISPDGRWISFLGQRGLRDEESGEGEARRVKNIPITDLYLMPSAGGFPQPLTSSGDVTVTGVWSPDGSSILFGRKQRLEILRLVIPDESQPGVLNTTTIYEGALYDPKLSRGDESLSYPRWRPLEGDWILFVTREDDTTTLRAVTADGNLHRKVLSSLSPIVAWDWSPDGQSVIFVTKSFDRPAGEINFLDFESGKIESVWEEEHYSYRTPLARWIDAGQIVLRSNRFGWTKFWIGSADGSNLHELTAGEFDENSFLVSPDGRQIVYSCRREGITGSENLWMTSLSGFEPRRINNQPGVSLPLMWSGEQIYYWHSSPQEPGDLWSVSSQNATSPVRLTFSASAELTKKLNAPRTVEIQNEGTSIPTLIYFPKFFEPGEKYPAIVWIRGGPTSASRFDFNSIYNFLANLGFIVVSPNYRGSVGCGVAHMDVVTGDGVGRCDLSDIAATAKYIRASIDDVDLSRGIGIGGHSWGGYLTLMAITSDEIKNEYSCAAAGAAIADWNIQQSETEVRWYDHWLMGGWTYDLNKRVKERSPSSGIENISVPLFVYHGEADRDVPFSQMKAFVGRVRGSGKQIEIKFYPGEGHNSKKAEHQADRLTRLASFFRKHLQSWNFTDNPCGDQEP